MRLGATMSVGLHAVVIACAWFGLPHLRSEPPELDDIVFVKLADLGDVTNVPPETRDPAREEPKPVPVKTKPEPKPKSKSKVVPPPVRSAAIPPPPPPPPPVAKPISKPAPAAVVVPKKPAPKPAPRPKPKTAAAAPRPLPRPQSRPVEPRSDTPPPRPKPPPKKKEPPAPRKFSSLLKNLKQEAPKPVAPVEKKKSLVERAREAARNQSTRDFDPNAAVTVSEIQAVRQQLAQCWNVAAGARRADALSVEIEMVMNSDATVREARVVDASRMNSDPYFRAAAESALRALGHPDCIPLKLPLDKYDVWKNFTFNFDPSKMLQ
jgi:hypothetical protein